MDKQYQKSRKQAGLFGAIVGSLLISNPAMAMPQMEVDQQLAQANPHPSIFDEPPYNHSRSTSPMTPGTGSMGQPNSPGNPSSTTPPDQTGTMGGQSDSPASSTSPQDPKNAPATIGSPYLRREDPSGAKQPTQGETGGPNPPATNASPYLQRQDPSGAKQPTQGGTGGPNPPATNGSPYLQRQDPSGGSQPGSQKSMEKQNLPAGNGASMPSPTLENQASPGSLPRSKPEPVKAIQPPLPEQQQPPSGMVMPIKGNVNVNLVNGTGAFVSYQVIGNTAVRSLAGNSTVMLQNLPTPLTVTFQRLDHGLVKVSLQSPKPGMLNVNLTPTTDLSQDKLSMRVQPTGSIFLN